MRLIKNQIACKPNTSQDIIIINYIIIILYYILYIIIILYYILYIIITPYPKRSVITKVIKNTIFKLSNLLNRKYSKDKLNFHQFL
jgi:hypothetical protein